MKLTITTVVISLALSFGSAKSSSAQSDLGAAVQNPISSLISLPFKFVFDNGADNGNAEFLNIQPVYPFTVGEWNFVSRAIVPLVNAPGGIPGLPNNPGVGDPTKPGNATGFGDINYTLFVSPMKPTAGGWTWGIGPSITAPTATDDRLGSGKWSGGLSAVALNQPGWGTYGGLVRHLWSFAGDKGRRDVSQSLIEPFVNYNLDDGWYLISDSVITYDWKLGKDKGWTVPVGGGVGRVTKIGNQSVNIRAETYYNVAKPDKGPNWTLGFTLQFLFPKG